LAEATAVRDEILSSPDKVVEKYFEMITHLARSKAGPDKADDVVQNVFMRYMRHYKDFTSEEHLKAWLIRATCNCAISELKNTWTERTTGIPDDERTQEFAVEPEYAVEEEDNGVKRAVMALPEKYRVVIHLYYYEEYPTAKIAEVLGKRESTVRSLLKRGREKLEKMLKGGGYYDE